MDNKFFLHIAVSSNKNFNKTISWFSASGYILNMSSAEAKQLKIKEICDEVIGGPTRQSLTIVTQGVSDLIHEYFTKMKEMFCNSSDKTLNKTQTQATSTTKAPPVNKATPISSAATAPDPVPAAPEAQQVNPCCTIWIKLHFRFFLLPVDALGWEHF